MKKLLQFQTWFGKLSKDYTFASHSFFKTYFPMLQSKAHFLQRSDLGHVLREKCPYSELFWCVFSCIRADIRIQSKCGKMRTTITPNKDTFLAQWQVSEWWIQWYLGITLNRHFPEDTSPQRVAPLTLTWKTIAQLDINTTTKQPNRTVTWLEGNHWTEFW